MRSIRAAAILLAFLILSPGCLSLFGGEESGSELVNCELDPNNPDCEISEVTEEDCFFNQVFTGDYCRLMTSPQNLDYGEESLLLLVGQEMQALTPRFTGDGPQNWQINPRLPEGLSLDLESGVISGVPKSETLLTSYTIIGKNIVGSSVYIIDIEVLSQPPENITYSANEIFCTISKPCGISSPYNSGGLIENWEVIPSLPLGLEILASGGISGTAQQLGDSNHTISGSNSGGSAYADIRIITIHEEPVNLYYSSNFFQWLLDDNIEESPNIEGGEIINWTIEPPLPDGLIFSQNDGSIIGIPSELHAIREHYVTATNTGGSITTTILISVQDISPTNIRYEPYLLDLTVNEEMSNLSPSWSDGTPESWEISPNLPQGLTLNPHNGEISGTPIYVQESMDYQIWANNTGGFTETQISISISSSTSTRQLWSAQVSMSKTLKTLSMPN